MKKVMLKAWGDVKLRKKPNEKCLHKIVQFFIDTKLCIETSRIPFFLPFLPLPSLPPTQLPSCFTLYPLRRKTQFLPTPPLPPFPLSPPSRDFRKCPCRGQSCLWFSIYTDMNLARREEFQSLTIQSGLLESKTWPRSPAELIHVWWMNEQKRWCLAFSLL